MIEQKEINKIAVKNRVSDRQIEKDYVLSWLLFAISKNKILYNALVFKGGTVLKKAYFKDYRFSEDLDFTLINTSVSNKQILSKEMAFKRDWEKKLTLQIHDLPKYEEVFRESKRHFKF